MNLLQRYINAVRQYLPEDLRDDVGRELKANIEDQSEASADTENTQNETHRMEQVLQQLGHPAKMAANYHPPSPLVSPALMPLYIKALGYTMGLLFALHTLDLSLGHIIASDFNLIRFLLQLSLGFLDTAAWVFTSITLVFYAVTATGSEDKWLGYDRWKPTDLPDIGHPWQQIKSSDTLTEVVTNIFLLLVIWQPLWRSGESLANSGFAFTDAFQQLFPAITALLLLSLVFNLCCLVYPYWNRATLMINTVQNLIYAGLLFYLASLEQKIIISDNSILDRADVDTSIAIGMVLVAIYLLYEALRDIRRLRLISV